MLFQILNLILTTVGAVAALSFIYVYSRYKWEESAEGVNAMLIGVTILFAAFARLTVIGLGGFLPAFVSPTLGAITWIGFAALLIHRIYIINSLHRPEEQHNNHKEEGQR